MQWIVDLDGFMHNLDNVGAIYARTKTYPSDEESHDDHGAEPVVFYEICLRLPSGKDTVLISHKDPKPAKVVHNEILQRLRAEKPFCLVVQEEICNAGLWLLFDPQGE